MEAATLISLIKKDEKISQFFRGCVPIDLFIDEAHLYKDPNSANFWIVYSSPVSSRELGHFFMFGCKNIILRKGENISPDSGTWYCDSYSLKPGHYSARLESTFANLSTYGSYQSVPFQLQSNNSNVCGLYSMLFAEKFCSKPTGETDLSDFVLRNFLKHNYVENDSRAISFYERKLGVPKRKLNCVGANFCTSLDKFLTTPRDTSLE
jgi:hypothetical protein